MHYFPGKGTSSNLGNVMSSTGGPSVFAQAKAEAGIDTMNMSMQSTQTIAQPRGLTRKVVHKMTFGEANGEVFCAKFDYTDKYLACGMADGMCRIYNMVTGKLAFSLQGNLQDDMPITCLAWRPVSAQLKTMNVMVTAQADGTLKHWHATSGKCLHQIPPEQGNSLCTIDFNNDGTLLATAGKDRYVRIYDETTKTMAFKMKEAGDLNGHSNRIFCVKFNPNDPNMLVSGGWDRTVQIYDLRVRGPVNFFFGPHICGETIDFRRDSPVMITGSYRLEDVLEVWDMRMMKRSKVIEWEGTGQTLFNEGEGEEYEASQMDATSEQSKSLQPSPSQVSVATSGPIITKKPSRSIASFLYTATFSRDQSLLFAGGSGINEMRVFDWESGNIVARISHLPKSILCGAVAHNSDLFMFGSADSRARIFEVEKNMF